LATLFPDDQGAAADAYAKGVLSYPAQMLVPHGTAVAQTGALVGWFRGQDPAGPRITAVSVPTLVADGVVDALDPVSNDHELAGLIPHAQLVLYPDAGHGFLFQDAGEFVPRVDAFLR
ncbi:MAG: alpha/beta hydrolase, partial [Actinomycetota bacterium]|nr:alpha/beta hydrolase [Actinomycetota bacterium]